MVKKYVITFSISVLVFFSLCVIMLMIMLPQEQASIIGTVQNYEKVNTADYKFSQTKDISKESLTKEYTISSSDILSFQKYNQYKAGNSDPFTPDSDLTDATNNNNQNNANNNTSNSNGGISNPPSSNK